MNIRVHRPSGKMLIALLLGALLIVGTILTIREVQRQQDIRQRAATAPTVCAVNQPSDTMLLFDKSVSMQEPTSPSDTTPRITKAKQAAISFVDLLAAQDTDSDTHDIGLVSFAGETSTTLDSQLTPQFDSVKTAINNIALQPETCIECAIKQANDEFAARGRPAVKHIAILLTDGSATRYIGIHPQPPYTEEDYREAERRAIAEAKKGYQQEGVSYFTIGFGDDVNKTFLQTVANETGGKYFFVPTAADLQGVFQEISTLIGKGSISGTVFNDDSGNGVLDGGETKLQGWTVDLYDASNTKLQSVQTDAVGAYTFVGVCDGAYTVREQKKTGWDQTLPQNNGNYTVAITDGSAAGGKDFGNKQQVLACPVSKALCRWDPVIGVDGYQVIVNELFPGTTKTPIQIITQTIQAPTTLMVFDAKPGSTYQCRVSGVNSCGTGLQGIATDSCPIPPTPTNTPSVTPTGTLSPTMTPTPTATLTPSVTPTGTLSPTLTPTRTPTPTITHTPTPTVTNTPTPTRTPTPTNSPTPTRTPTPIPTSTPRPPSTPGPTQPPGPTQQPPVPTNAPEPTTVIAIAPTNTPFPTGVPIPTNTPRPTIAPTGDGTTSTIIGIAAAVLTILGGVIFILL